MAAAVVLTLVSASRILQAASPAGGLRYIEHEQSAGMSGAVVVDNQALAHTAQVFATGPNGEPPSGTAGAQVERTLDNLLAALTAAGSGFDRIVRVHVCVTAPETTAVVEHALARRFSGGAKPAVTFVSGNLSAPGALVAMDAVAAAPSAGPNVVTRISPGLPHAGNERHVAVLPSGSAVFISGYAERGEADKAAAATMGRLGSALKQLVLSTGDVVQVKAFVATDTSVEVVRREIQAFFGSAPVPPLVFVQWATAQPPVEIELIAAGRVSAGEKPLAAIEYITPPGEKANPFFSRVVRVNRGKLIYVAGLFGRTEQAAEPQIREIFADLRSLLQKAGSDFDHMAKATYYVTDKPASDLLNVVRRELYNPERPPAASKINVTGTGRAGETITLDMIAVAPGGAMR